ncbi:MAG: PEP-CTERM sorting domain-containing protein [Akkermansiaceae bacterium]|nr:PEP-CTERM sorting domain-containing protein [Akkermansiaceae bacterium]
MAGLIAASVTLLTTPSKALNIELDYSYDAGTDHFFETNERAKSALEKAAADISALINTTLAPVQETYTGSDGFTSVTFDWDYLFINPTDGTQESISNPSLAANTVKIFVGVRELAGVTLASGGPAGVQLGISASNISPTYLQNAIDEAVVNSNNGIGRGAGPVIQNINGTTLFGGYPGSYNLDIGAGIGNLWFDVDTDNKKGKDSDSTLESFWHFDHTTPVDAGKYDLYSVALHEMLHVVGLGTSTTWDDQISGATNWTGSHVINLYGTGNGLIESGSGHVADGTMSTRLDNGSSQTAVVVPFIGMGERRLLTELDAAFLRDLGYSTVPESSSTILILSATVFLFLRRNKQPVGRPI